MVRIKHTIDGITWTNDICDLYSVISTAMHYGFMQALVVDPFTSGKREWDMYNDMLDALKGAAIDGTLLDDEMHELTFSCEEA